MWLFGNTSFIKYQKYFYYLYFSPKKKKCCIIDAVWDFDYYSCRFSTKIIDKMVEFINENKYQLEYILETHVHADHISGMNVLKEKLGGKIAVGSGITAVQKHWKKVYNLDIKDDGSQFDQLLKEGDELYVGDVKIIVWETTGHTPDSISFYIPNRCIIVGDTVFQPDCTTARCDFPSGSPIALYKSVQRILSLDDSIIVYVGHDYPKGERGFQFLSTVKQQKEENPHCKINEEEFVKTRTERDKTLGPPNLLFPSVQININAGKLPEQEGNNISFLKIPINFYKK
eukprot:TRINITY_DN6106_c0_g1_i1.p1 TRINITY_DN6106_c0_g1~~TRINITY_DN6106_c0_g1_i1.p1  ORF type:complete len:286 (+),score=46.92 TRINITY_DN6106_c0_g1_i1:75-932(+)